MKQNNLFILSKGRVAAINKKDGCIIWEVNLKSYVNSSVVYNIGQLTVEDNRIYIGIAGILLCLSTKDGSLIWKNELKGWGYQFISMSNSNSEAASAETERAAAAASVFVATTKAHFRLAVDCNDPTVIYSDLRLTKARS